MKSGTFILWMNLESAVRYQFFNRKAAEVAKERKPE